MFKTTRLTILILALACSLLPTSLLALDIDIVSRSSHGMLGNGPSSQPALNDDGRFVAFVSDADNLVDDDFIPWYWGTDPDIFLLDRESGQVENLSRDLNPDDWWFIQTTCKDPSLAGDGQLAAFVCASGYHVKYRELFRVFLFDRTSQTLGLVSQGLGGRIVNGPSSGTVLSQDGSTLVFVSESSNLLAGDTDTASDVYLFDIHNETLELVSTDTSGVKGNSHSYAATVSGDGRRVAYVSHANNLVADDTNLYADVFVLDRREGTLERIPSPAAADCGEPTLSADGRTLAFVSYENDTNRIYLRVDAGEPWQVAEGDSPALSGDGRFLAYVAPLPGAPDGVKGVMRREVHTGNLTLVGTTRFNDSLPGHTLEPALDAHGSVWAFASDAPDIVPGDDNDVRDVFVAASSEDTTPPELELAVSQDILWPPNKKFKEIQVSGLASDDSGQVQVELVLNDEYGSVVDQVIPGFGSTVWLEAWRDGDDLDGRVYTITAVATDPAGNRSEATATVLVPHDMRNK